MKLHIGENLRKLRLQRGITQEQLADTLGVSAQAVSRWENDLAYPDITMLPGIAMFYGTTIDAIVSMDTLRDKQALNRIHGEIHRLRTSGSTEQALQLIRESLRLYPSDSGLLIALSETLAHKDSPAALDEAIHVSERVLQNDDISMQARCTATVNLIFLYLRSGREDQAASLVESLPHIWESREMIAPESSCGEYKTALRESVRKALVLLCKRIDAQPSRICGESPDYIQLGVDFASGRDVRDMLRQIEEFMEE